MPENKGYLTSDRSAAGDERYTPVYAVVPLLEFTPPPSKTVIWCPFDKEQSAFVKVFRDAGYKVDVATLITGKISLHMNQKIGTL